MKRRNVLKERWLAPTPYWFKQLIRLSLTLATIGGAVLTAPKLVEGFVLPPTIKEVATWCVVAGIAAAATSKTGSKNH